MSDPVAYLLTWTTYGTWLPGDARGWVDHGRPNVSGGIREGDSARSSVAQSKMKAASRRLSESAREIVARTIREVCEFRRWSMLAVNCRTSHLHVVVCAMEISPEHVMNQLKSWCSRPPNLAVPGQDYKRYWTRRGSTHYLWTMDAVEVAVDYVFNRQ